MIFTPVFMFIITENCFMIAMEFRKAMDAEAEAPILWPPDAKSQLTEKNPDSGKD